jgi:hypothetical protein
MEFRIADTFTDSLARLTGDEQKAARCAVPRMPQPPRAKRCEHWPVVRAALTQPSEFHNSAISYLKRCL